MDTDPGKKQGLLFSEVDVVNPHSHPHWQTEWNLSFQKSVGRGMPGPMEPMEALRQQTSLGRNEVTATPLQSFIEFIPIYFCSPSMPQ